MGFFIELDHYPPHPDARKLVRLAMGFSFLAIGPVLGIWAMVMLRKLPEARSLAGKRLTMNQARGLTQSQVVEFYDHLGAKQDKQKYYEDTAIADLLMHARFDVAYTAVEYGSGTGRFAEQLLGKYLPMDAAYWGCDVSTTMINLSQKRLSPFGHRATLWKSMGETSLPLPSEYADRFVSNYVLDMLSFDEIHDVIREAKRVLKKDGLLCLTGLTNGKGWFSKLWTAFWNIRFAVNPKWVGGCRPIEVHRFLNVDWEIEHYRVVAVRGISSEVIVARKR
jgi:ubiquinone/menaquinone biosynthesis C-methylase UbiE